MSIYVILGVIVAIIFTTIIFVVVGAIEKHKKLNINWLLLMATIILSCILVMVVIYHNQHDITPADVQASYNQGVEDGKSSASHTIPTNEEMEQWFSSTKEVVVGTNSSDYAVHIIDHAGEERVLYANEVVEK